MLSLIVPAAETGTALAADGIDFVDEDDGGGLLASRLEEVANATRADTHEHLHEVRTGHGEEGDTRFTGDRSSNQRLTGARGTHEQHALGNLGANVLVASGGLEELHDFVNFHLDAVVARHIFKGGGGLIEVKGLCLRARDRHHAAHLAAPHAGDEQPNTEEDHDVDDVGEPGGGKARRVRELNVDTLGTQFFDVTGNNGTRSGRAVLRAIRQGAGDDARGVRDGGRRDVVTLGVRQEGAVGNRLHLARVQEVGNQEDSYRHGDNADGHKSPTLLRTHGPGRGAIGLLGVFIRCSTHWLTA